MLAKRSENDSLKKRIIEIYSSREHNSTRVSKILGDLELDKIIRKCFEFSKDALLKTIILGRLKRIKFDIKLVEYLKNHQDEALDFGFYKDANNQ